MTDERRTRFRCNTIGEAPVVLRRSGTDHEARLVDQSAEGFAVGVRQLNTKEGEKLQLRTRGGWSEVEVVHCQEEGGETIVGLRTLAELPDPRDRVRNSLAFFATRARGPAAKVGPAMAIGILCVLGFWAYMLFTAYKFAR